MQTFRLIVLAAISAFVPVAHADVPPKTDIPRAIPSALADHPGNIFLRGQNVIIPVPGGAGAAAWECSDYEKRVVLRGKGERADLGQLPAGYYELVAVDGGGKRVGWTSLGVLEPLRAATPQDSPICLDVAMSWFYQPRPGQAGQAGRPSQARQAASLSALAGVNWVRDRLAWEHVQSEPGKALDHTAYDDSARVQAEAGLKVLQVFHNTPRWAGSNPKRFAEDLRQPYRFLKEFSRRWRGQVLAWEPWNEADIDAFGGHSGAEIASYQKACWWGLREGNPETIACQNVFAVDYPATHEDFIRNEPSAYFHTFNFHHYRSIDSFGPYYATMRRSSGGRPLWVTEAGTHVHWEGEFQEPPWPAQQVQARYVTQCLAASVHEGSAATYYFLLPHYVEGQVQFGLLHKDLTPRPSYLSLAAAGRLLAGAKPLGRLDGPGQPALRAFALAAQPDGRPAVVLVAWSVAGTAKLDVGQAKIRAAYDFLGRAIPQAPGEVAQDPVYLVLEADAKGQLALTPPSPPAPLGAGQPCPLVLQSVMARDKLDLNTSAYKLPAEGALEVPLFAYNFGPGQLKTRLVLSAEGPVRADLSGAELTLQPMDRLELRLTVSPQLSAAGGEAKVSHVTLRADCGPAGQSVLSLRFVPAKKK